MDSNSRGLPWRIIAVYATLSTVVCLLISTDTQADGSSGTMTVWVPALLLSTAVFVSRFRPSLGLILLALAAAARITMGAEAANDIVAVAIVTFNCGRRGRQRTIGMAAAFILLAYLSGGLYAVSSGTQIADALADQGASYLSAFAFSVLGTVAPLGMPLLMGFTLRTRERAQHNRLMQLRAEGERNMSDALRVVAEDVARAESEKSALARDVHDVVGHSLAVILAQAESGLFLRADQPEEIRKVLRTIADSARSSLDDVRGVLQPSRATRRSTELDDLLESLPPNIVVENTVHGAPLPLNPALEVVVRRTLQEMLTNALKHGDGGGIRVRRDWSDGLTLTVINATTPGPRGTGLGLDGMQRRVEGVNGRFRSTDTGNMYMVEAFIPRTADFGIRQQ